jgi:hypothetical protein
MICLRITVWVAVLTVGISISGSRVDVLGRVSCTKTGLIFLLICMLCRRQLRRYDRGLLWGQVDPWKFDHLDNDDTPEHDGRREYQ